MKNFFVSFSHRDTQWKDRVVKHLEVLEKQGYYRKPGDGGCNHVNSGPDTTTIGCNDFTTEKTGQAGKPT